VKQQPPKKMNSQPHLLSPADTCQRDQVISDVLEALPGAGGKGGGEGDVG